MSCKPNPAPTGPTAVVTQIVPPQKPEGGLNEGWWKKALVIVGFMYINGYLASRAFYASLGLASSDFTMAEYDYLVQGLLYLLLDYQSIVHPHWAFFGYYLWWLCTWPLLWFSLRLAFWKGSKRKVWLQPALLVVLAVAITAVATFHGRERANVLKALTEKLPNALVYYAAKEKAEGVISGRLVSRTEKCICLTSIDGWEIQGTNQLERAANEPDERFFVIPFEKIQTIIFK